MKLSREEREQEAYRQYLLALEDYNRGDYSGAKRKIDTAIKLDECPEYICEKAMIILGNRSLKELESGSADNPKMDRDYKAYQMTFNRLQYSYPNFLPPLFRNG